MCAKKGFYLCVVAALAVWIVFFILINSVAAAPRGGHAAHVTKHGSFTYASGSVMGYEKGQKVKVCGATYDGTPKRGRCIVVTIRDVWHPDDIPLMEARNVKFDLGKLAYETVCGRPWDEVWPYWDCHAVIGR